MNKRGRFLGLGVVGTLALLASLIVASASAVAQNGDLPDFGDLNNVMPPPQMEAMPEAAEPADGPSGQDDGSEGNQDADPTQPVAPPAASPTAEEVRPPAPKSSLSTHVSGRDSARGSCTMYTTSATNAPTGFPFLDTPAGTWTRANRGTLLGTSITLNYGNGPTVHSASRNCTSIQERYLIDSSYQSVADCPNDNYGAWQSIGSAYCVRTISPAFWRQ